MTATMQQQQQFEKTLISAQEKWANGTKFERELMLREIGESNAFAVLSWKKLGHIAKLNLINTTWYV